MTTRNRYLRTRGAINGQLIAIIGLLLLVVALSGLSAWLYTMYDEQKTKVDNKVDLAIAAAKKEQAEVDEVKIKKVEEEPSREFAGPDDYGRVTFKYPKNWSVYVDSDASTGGGEYEAYLNPIVVPSIKGTTPQFALRVTIENVAYDEVLDSYKATVKKGDLSSSPVSVNGHDGTRLDGSFTKDLRGAAVLFKVRDKTVTIQTDADTFKPYFEDIIKTIDFNS
jgi:hypothetical protein